MTNIQIITSTWNKDSIDYYQPIINSLKEHNIMTAQTLLLMDIRTLCKMTKITKQVMRAFIKQVCTTMKLAEEDQNKGVKRLKTKNDYLLCTGLKSLDTLIGGGIYTSQIVEICGDTGSSKERFTIHLLTSFISTYGGDDVYLYDTTGMFKPRSTTNAKLLENITCTQISDLNHFYVSLDNLTTLLTIKDKDTTPSFILIHDISILITDWTRISKLVETFKTLSRLNCMIIILNNTTIDFTPSQYEVDWNPMIDTRLFLTKENQVKVVKSRHQKTTK